MGSELERLIEEQARDMRVGNRVPRQGEPWMHQVYSLDATGGKLIILKSRDEWRCNLHGRRFSGFDSVNRPQCAECHREHMRAYSRSPKGRARHARYRQRPEVQERRRAQQEARRRARGVPPAVRLTPEEAKRRKREQDRAYYAKKRAARSDQAQ